jgi:hypothetical protein
MQAKMASLASQSEKRRAQQNANVGYFGEKSSQNKVLDEIDLLLRGAG